MTDIVERLRQKERDYYRRDTGGAFGMGQVLREAAAEIERLQARLAEAESNEKAWEATAQHHYEEARAAEKRLAEADDLLAQAYPILMAYGVCNSTKFERVLMMDAIKLHLETTDSADAAYSVVDRNGEPCYPVSSEDPRNGEAQNPSFEIADSAAECHHAWSSYDVLNVRCMRCGTVKPLEPFDATTSTVSAVVAR